jgi:hypothetical protein
MNIDDILELLHYTGYTVWRYDEAGYDLIAVPDLAEDGNEEHNRSYSFRVPKDFLEMVVWQLDRGIIRSKR